MTSSENSILLSIVDERESDCLEWLGGAGNCNVAKRKFWTMTNYAGFLLAPPLQSEVVMKGQ
nr:hypothetical protein [Ferrovum sp.]